MEGVVDDVLRKELREWGHEGWLRKCAVVGGAVAFGIWQRSYAAAFFGVFALAGLFELVVYLGALGIVLGRINDLLGEYVRGQQHESSDR